MEKTFADVLKNPLKIYKFWKTCPESILSDIISFKGENEMSEIENELKYKAREVLLFQNPSKYIKMDFLKDVLKNKDVRDKIIREYRGNPFEKKSIRTEEQIVDDDIPLLKTFEKKIEDDDNYDEYEIYTYDKKSIKKSKRDKYNCKKKIDDKKKENKSRFYEKKKKNKWIARSRQRDYRYESIRSQEIMTKEKEYETDLEYTSLLEYLYGDEIFGTSSNYDDYDHYYDDYFSFNYSDFVFSDGYTNEDFS